MSRFLRILPFAIVLAAVGCGERAQNDAPSPAAIAEPAAPMVSENPVIDRMAEARKEMAKFADVDSEDGYLQWAKPSVDELQLLPQLPRKKELDIRQLQVTRDHLDVLVNKCPNIERISLMSAVITPDLFLSLPKLKLLRELSILQIELDDAALAPLRGLPLTELGIANNSVTDTGMEVVGTMQSLTYLNVAELDLTDAGMRHLEGLSNLTGLRMGYTKVSDAGLKSIGQLTNLTSINLNHTQITDAGFLELGRLKKLTSVEANCSGLTDHCLTAVLEWPAIEQLDLWDTQITDAGLPILAKSKTLKYLAVGRTTVTDAGLPHLYQSSLLSLNLSDTATTLPAIEELKKEVPGITVIKYGQTQ